MRQVFDWGCGRRQGLGFTLLSPEADDVAIIASCEYRLREG